MSARTVCRGRVAIALLAIAGGAHGAQGQADAAREARMFLLRYVGLTATSDINALSMYRDDARIRVSAWQGGRQIQTGIARGKDWKQQLRAGWFEGTTKLEASSFQDAGVSAQGRRLVIHAKRYSQTRCYWDQGYAVAIEPDQAGQYQIVEERLTFQRDAFCAPQAAAPNAVAVVPPSAAVPAAPSTLSPPATRLTGLPPNVAPSGQGLPRMPASIGAAPAQAGVASQPPN